VEPAGHRPGGKATHQVARPSTFGISLTRLGRNGQEACGAATTLFNWERAHLMFDTRKPALSSGRLAGPEPVTKAIGELSSEP
jgi:hypothetical protein